MENSYRVSIELYKHDFKPIGTRIFLRLFFKVGYFMAHDSQAFPG